MGNIVPAHHPNNIHCSLTSHVYVLCIFLQPYLVCVSINSIKVPSSYLHAPARGGFQQWVEYWKIRGIKDVNYSFTYISLD